MSSKDSEKLETSLYAKDMAKNEYGMPIIFKPSSSIAKKTDPIPLWKSLHAVSSKAFISDGMGVH